VRDYAVLNIDLHIVNLGHLYCIITSTPHPAHSPLPCLHQLTHTHIHHCTQRLQWSVCTLRTCLWRFSFAVVSTIIFDTIRLVPSTLALLVNAAVEVLKHNGGPWNAYITKQIWFFISFSFIRKPILFRSWKKLKILINFIVCNGEVVKQEHYLTHFLSLPELLWKTRGMPAIPLIYT